MALQGPQFVGPQQKPEKRDAFEKVLMGLKLAESAFGIVSGIDQFILNRNSVSQKDLIKEGYQRTDDGDPQGSEVNIQRGFLQSPEKAWVKRSPQPMNSLGLLKTLSDAASVNKAIDEGVLSGVPRINGNDIVGQAAGKSPAVDFSDMANGGQVDVNSQTFSHLSSAGIQRLHHLEKFRQEIKDNRSIEPKVRDSINSAMSNIMMVNTVIGELQNSPELKRQIGLLNKYSPDEVIQMSKTPDFQRFRSKLSLWRAEYRKMLTGTAASEREIEEEMRRMPNESDLGSETFVQKAVGVAEYSNQLIRTLVDSQRRLGRTIGAPTEKDIAIKGSKTASPQKQVNPGNIKNKQDYEDVINQIKNGRNPNSDGQAADDFLERLDNFLQGK